MIKKTGPLKALIFVLTGLVLLTNCKEAENFSIEGKLPDKSFDGEWIYMVPTMKGSINRVDSTIIKNAQFSFKGNTAEPEIFVLRTRPFLRIMLQELIIVKEQGAIEAYIGQNSQVKGTTLNDLLQGWQDQKEVYDQHTKLLDHYYYAGTFSQRDSLKPTMNALAYEQNNFHFEFASDNQENVVGQMVMQMMSDSFTDEQRKELKLQ